MRTGIGLGSNLGNRLENLEQAVSCLAKLSCSRPRLLISKIYETEPVDCEKNAMFFYNMTVEFDCEISAPLLLTELKQIETRLGRPEQRQRNVSRVIDLDLLYMGNQIISEEDLSLPHPRLTQRRFVLQPLADIRPDLILPGQDKNIATLLAELDSPEPPLQPVSAPSFDDRLTAFC